MHEKDIASQLLGVVGYIYPQIPVDATDLDGIQVDRLSYPHKSALAVLQIKYTAAGGGAGDTQTVELRVEHDDAVGWGTVATLKTYSRVFTWAANGANYGTLCLPVDLSSAKRYIRITGKVTKAGAQTISLQYMSGCIILGGAPSNPNALHVNAGYSAIVEAA